MASFGFLLPLADFDGHMDWDGGWGVLMVLGMVLLWALVIGGIIWLIRELGRSRSTEAGRAEDPLKILDRRLADGSITPEEYRERRTVLSDQKPPSR